MTSRRTLLILVLNLLVVIVLSEEECSLGYGWKKKKCVDMNECEDNPCGLHQWCNNTEGSFQCLCEKGFKNVTSTPLTCTDDDECEDGRPCGENAACINTIGSYYCVCNRGYKTRSGKLKFTMEEDTCEDLNECELNPCDDDDDKQECINTVGSFQCLCKKGFKNVTSLNCIDLDECENNPCNKNHSVCVNTEGSFQCQCKEGFKNATSTHCIDDDECAGGRPCGENAACVNTIGSYDCVCNPGYKTRSGKSTSTKGEEICEDICTLDKTICGNGTCHSGYHCTCDKGFTNYGNNKSRCAELKCDAFANRDSQKLPVQVQDILKKLNDTCWNFTEKQTPTAADFNADHMLEQLLKVLDNLLSGGDISDKKHVSTVLNIVETALKMIVPLTKMPNTEKSKMFRSNHTELEVSIRRDGDPPQGLLSLTSSELAHLDIQWETAAGIASSYPGFATVSLLSYKNLESVSGIKPSKDFQINSKVVTASVSNRDTDLLKDPVVLTFGHLTQEHERNHVCAFWDSTLDGGAWSTRGCKVMNSTPDLTVCSCNHLSSFAVLMALYDFKHPFELQLISYVGLSLSLLCLFLCILTFALIRAIQSPRNTIHLHLCISLFIANLVFLVGISRTENQTGCAVVAGLLHFFYLAAFCWMCLEGIQLFRMVVLVFNTTFRPLYMMAGGYGIPATIVIVSAIANSKGYGTGRHCWLSLEDGFIWAFFGPACAIIMINIFFFLITVWKLAEKFSSLNPDLDKLRKIKAFVITAVAQLCVLGIMWIFGCFQFNQSTIALSYVFTLLNSLQGVMLFVLHCLLPKQVREEYGKLFPRIRSPQKKKYTDFTNSQSSKPQSSNGGQNTGESRI